MRENHPDSLAARGVPQEFVKRATDKVAEINAAWDRVKRERIDRLGAVGTQGWYFNTRREAFQDRRIREALILAFDFEWTNQNIMFGMYKRLHSYFENSEMKAAGTPGPEELALLEPFRGKVPDEVFGEPFVPPVSDGSGSDRNLLRRADALLREAGCKREGNVLRLPSGKPFEIEFLDFSPALQPHTQPFQANLKRLGIEARSRIVDPAQYQRRMDEFDFEPYIGTLENDGVGIAPFHNFEDKVRPELAAELDEVKAGIIDGSIEVTSYLS